MSPAPSMHHGGFRRAPTDRRGVFARMRRGLFPFVVFALISGCTSLPRAPAPLDDDVLADIPGISGARFWGDTHPDQLDEITAMLREQRQRSGVGQEALLALSGGADDGAFGAGLLNAWTDRGDRPEFILVTGVSTGALSAPFAFLGPRYDQDLRAVYGGFPPERIFQLRSIFGILRSNSAADDGPLADLIAEFVDDAMLADVAIEHRRGRRLFVQTTHLDAQRPVIWDMGRIAESDAPNAEALFEKVLLASASVPGVFPPVIVDVMRDGEVFDELHVDGGVVSEFTVPEAWQQTIHADPDSVSDARATLYLIRNGRVKPQPEATRNSLFGVASRSLSTLLKFHGIGDMDRAHAAARSRGIDYRATWITESFDAPKSTPFDQAYMAALFDYGYQRMLRDEVWSDEPPDW